MSPPAMTTGAMYSNRRSPLTRLGYKSVSTVVPSEDDSTIQELVDFLNTNTEITILLDNSAVAKGEFYVDQDTYEEYNYNTGQYETVTEDVLNIHMLFNDGSTQDLEVYFDDSFNELENKLDTVLDNFENSLDEALDD